MREADPAALRRLTLIHALSLAVVGTGRCPLCHQRAEVFARRSAPPGPTKECCLECWNAQRSAPARRWNASRAFLGTSACYEARVRIWGA